MNELVIMKDDQAITTSLMISAVFGKEHKHVIESIENLAAENSTAKNLFHKSTYENRGKDYKQYLMNRDGFTLLAMGFTGKKALEFKIQYIEAFNQMEKQLSLRTPTTMVEALEMALITAKENEALKLENCKKDQVIGELKPKADYTDTILKSKSLVTISQISKDYGMSGVKMNQILFDLGVQYKQSGQWLLYAKHQAKGYTHSETIDIVRTDGRRDVTMNTKWTQKGRLFLYELLKSEGVLPIIEMKG